MGREAVILTIQQAQQALDAVAFKTTTQYTGPMEHQYIMSGWSDTHLDLWHAMRTLIAEHGEDRPFFKSRQRWRYLDMPDGYTYWVMPPWIADDWHVMFDPNDWYVLNRKPTHV